MGRNRSASPEHAYHSIVLVGRILAFSRQLPAFARFSQIPGGGGWGVCNRKFTVSYRKRKLSSCFRRTKGLHKRCMNIKQNYILASHASTLTDMFGDIGAVSETNPSSAATILKVDWDRFLCQVFMYDVKNFEKLPAIVRP